MCCYSEDWEQVEPRLARPYFGMHRFDDIPDEPTEYNLPYGEWIRLFREHGFRVEALVEVRPPEGAESTYRSRRGDRVGAIVADGGDLAMPEDLTDHAARNQDAWARVGSGVRRRRRAELGDRRDRLGDPQGARERGADAPRRRRARTWSSWAAGLRTSLPGSRGAGARVVGVDLTEEQLATARRMQAQHGLEFPLVHASAEDVPLPDASFDLAVSEYGASIWCDPDLWIAEAARLLRPGGELVFLVNGTFLMLTSPDVEPVAPAGTELLRPYFGMRRFEWVEDTSIDFHLGYGDWIRVLTSHGFEVEQLVELRNPGRDSGAVRDVHGGLGRALAGRGDVESTKDVSALPLLLASTSPSAA